MANSSTTPFIAALTLVLTAKGALVVVSFTVRFCKAIVISTNFGLLLFLMVRAKVCFMGSVSTVVNHVLMFPRVPLQVSRGGGGEVSSRKSVVQSACRYDVTSSVSDFQNGEQSVHRRDE